MTQDIPPSGSSPPPKSPKQRFGIPLLKKSSPTANSSRRTSTSGPSEHDAGAQSPPPRSQSRPLGPRSPPSSTLEHARSPRQSASLPIPTAPPDSSPTKRDRPGSSRTRYRVGGSSPTKTSVLGVEIHEAPGQMHEAPSEVHQTENRPMGVDQEIDAPHAPYRPPEAVIEPQEQQPLGYVPGVVAEHMDDDDVVPVSPLRERDLGKGEVFEAQSVNDWQAQVRGYSDSMDIDDIGLGAERPQIGPGISIRRCLQLAHEHEVFRPVINELPQPAAKKSHAPAASTTSIPDNSPYTANRSPHPPGGSGLTRTQSPMTPSLPDYERICTVSDVWDAAPGGETGHENWFFCPTCWVWIRVAARRSADLPRAETMDEWEKSFIGRLKAQGPDNTGAVDADHVRVEREKRLEEWGRFNDIKTSRMTAERTEVHLHEFRTIHQPQPGNRLERAPIDHADLNAFPHITMGEEVAPKLEQFISPEQSPRLLISCSSPLWIELGESVPGQIPVALMREFTAERLNNPRPGMQGTQTVLEAWTMLSTLVGNALFRGQRGWVDLNNPKFQRSLGMSQIISLMLFYIGFACRQEPETLRVGPYSKGEHVTTDDVQKMDNYMLRVWLEIQIFLAAFRKRNDLDPPVPNCVSLQTFDDALVELKQYPRYANGYPDVARSACLSLGIAKYDTAETVDKAYDLQIGCDSKNAPAHLSALVLLSEQSVSGMENLQMKVAMERSMQRYTKEDINEAYIKIGYTNEHASDIDIEATDAPEHYILDLHKKAMQAASNQNERNAISQALVIIGKERNSDTMKRLGESGQTQMSVDDAYAALSAPRDAVDDGLIMQYEMAVGEYPGKLEHYRTCLRIIAESDPEQRAGLKKFLGGVKETPPPVRKDIPVGLHNIGNTCYLNSILQYLYSIKPLREAVMAFEEPSRGSNKGQRKPEVDRSQRFVTQLRQLFLQLYRSEEASVRPDEELAYLAITRPETDAMIEPPRDSVPSFPTLDSIPDIPSPSSTRVATPEPSPPATLIPLPPSSPRMDTPTDETSPRTVLGKRQSEDRDSLSSSKSDLALQQRSEGFEEVDMDGKPFEDFEMVGEEEKVSSPSATADLAELRLKTPLDEGKDANETMYEPPSVPPPLPARPQARRASTLASGLKFGLQQDSAEVLINVLTQLELAFDPAAAEGEEKPSNLISDLFSCKYRQQMFVQSQDGDQAQTPVESVFVHPIIGVEEEGKDLHDCLGELYLTGNEIEYEGKKGYIMDVMDTFPPMLYIQMRRSQFDITTGRERKTNTHIPFSQNLCMDRYLSDTDPTKRELSIQQTWKISQLRSLLHQLRDNKPLSIPGTFAHVKDGLQALEDVPELELTPDFLSALDSESQAVSQRIEAIQGELRETKENLETMWSDDKRMEYELVAVFMHRGRTSGSGHYWTYQAYLPDQSDKFFKYNDESVTEVPASEVLMDRTGSDANPALLCYVRKDRRLVDTLHREVLERETSGADVAGKDKSESLL